MASSHAEQSGMSRDDFDAIEARAARLERFVADTYDGEPFDPDWADVYIPGFGPVDVKSVPNVEASFVNGGSRCPVVTAIVVTESPRQLVLGLVDPDRWTFGVPTVLGPTGRPCWHVRRADVFPPTGRWLKFDCVAPDWYALDDDEIKRAGWRISQRSKRDRERVERERLWDDIPDSKSGHASVAGHRPGADPGANTKRRRPPARRHRRPQ